MSYEKLSVPQYIALCHIIEGFRKLHTEASKLHNLSKFDENSYNKTSVSKLEASELIRSLCSSMNNIYPNHHNS